MKTVLIVDDSKVVRSMVVLFLTRFGCTVIEAANGQEGVEAARLHQPNLVLMDLLMPVMDGREALAAMRNDAATSAIPVIMLTAERGRDIVVEIARLGVSGYIVKPFSPDMFQREVSKVLGPPRTGPSKHVTLDPRAVLVVDDSVRVLEAASAALTGPFSVTAVASAQEAIERFLDIRPGVVVVDLMMPDMDGFTALAKLRELGKCGAVALAVRGEAGLHERARAAGYNAIVDKPFQAHELLDHVVGAASANSSPEDLLRAVLGEEQGCPVLHLPDPRSKAFGRIMPILGKQLRTLAESGADRLVVDVQQIAEVSSELIRSLTRLIAEAKGIGIRTAVCTANVAVETGLRQITETRDTPCRPDRDAARASLE